PAIVERAFVVPPPSRIGPATAAERKQVISDSVLSGHYEKIEDRESAYEMLKERAAAATKAAEAPKVEEESGGGLFGSVLGSVLGGSAPGPRGGTSRQRAGILEAAATSAARSIGSGIGRQILRGVLGSILGGKR
ncbi:MAG: DUF853 family protein, partial [Burkholderiales bacterium]|nr:DUF853 family protein [Burkholderiales bacterium]